MKDNRTSVKRSLFVSAIALTLTAALLIGTTFAWFTSTAQTSVSDIQAGTLEVKIVDEDGNAFENNTISFVDADNHANVLWEPNATFQTQKFKIKSSGTLALTYKLTLNVPTGDNVLLNNIDFSVVDKDGHAVSLDNFEATLTPANNTSGVYTIKGHMSKDASNDCQGKTLNGISLAVVAKQATYEKDSTGDQYDANAEYPAYPKGVTTETFTKNNSVVVDQNGKFYTSVEEAIKSSTVDTLYFKENSTVTIGDHILADGALTIYGNGADFQNKDISVGFTETPATGDHDIKIYNAKNLYVWGNPSSSNHTIKVLMENCVVNNSPLVMLRGSSSNNDTVDVTIKNCTANGYTDSVVHTTTDGTVTVDNCVFNNAYAGVNVAHKQDGTMTMTVTNCTFNNCGFEATGESDYFAPVRYVNNNATGRLTGTLKNNIFTNTNGTNGDILLGDYRTGKDSHAVTVVLETTSPVMVKNSAAAPYQLVAGTHNLAVNN